MKTAPEVHSAIMVIVDDRRIAAAKSDYDWKVCVRAVAAAAALIQGVPVAGTPREYCGAVLSGLQKLFDDYYDVDGEYTSGRSDIGTIISRIESLEKSLPILAS
ncbi:hypothetical protein [Mesorhizobium sp. KR9-304]|uniref:hypothetical protein n=1 Tax=Mesorhizobium sp. KR9-304 TaxID=3156614 RepID=UPI0032B39B34